MNFKCNKIKENKDWSNNKLLNINNTYNQNEVSYYLNETNEFNLGDIVWGKINGYNWWPGKVISYKYNEYLVNFYGDNTNGYLTKSNIKNYKQFYNLYSNYKGKGLLNAIKLANKDLTILNRTYNKFFSSNIEDRRYNNNILSNSYNYNNNYNTRRNTKLLNNSENKDNLSESKCIEYTYSTPKRSGRKKINFLNNNSYKYPQGITKLKKGRPRKEVTKTLSINTTKNFISKLNMNSNIINEVNSNNLIDKNLNIELAQTNNCNIVNNIELNNKKYNISPEIVLEFKNKCTSDLNNNENKLDYNSKENYSELLNKKRISNSDIETKNKEFDNILNNQFLDIKDKNYDNLDFDSSVKNLIINNCLLVNKLLLNNSTNNKGLDGIKLTECINKCSIKEINKYVKKKIDKTTYNFLKDIKVLIDPANKDIDENKVEFLTNFENINNSIENKKEELFLGINTILENLSVKSKSNSKPNNNNNNSSNCDNILTTKINCNPNDLLKTEHISSSENLENNKEIDLSNKKYANNRSNNENEKKSKENISFLSNSSKKTDIKSDNNIAKSCSPKEINIKKENAIIDVLENNTYSSLSINKINANDNNIYNSNNIINNNRCIQYNTIKEDIKKTAFDLYECPKKLYNFYYLLENCNIIHTEKMKKQSLITLAEKNYFDNKDHIDNILKTNPKFITMLKSYLYCYESENDFYTKIKISSDLDNKISFYLKVNKKLSNVVKTYTSNKGNHKNLIFNSLFNININIRNGFDSNLEIINKLSLYIELKFRETISFYDEFNETLNKLINKLNIGIVRSINNKDKSKDSQYMSKIDEFSKDLMDYLDNKYDNENDKKVILKYSELIKELMLC